MSTPKGKFAWYELMTTDTAAAGTFYSAVVGWNIKDVSMPDMPYSIFNVGELGVAGLMSLPEAAGTKPAWIGYILVDDVDAEAEKVKAAGGSIHRPPTDVPGMLRFSVVTDPQGAPYVLFTSNPAMPSPPAYPAPGTPGTFGWRELMAGDGQAAFDFYSSHYGWTKGEAHDMGPMGAYQIFDVDGVPSGGMMTKPPNLPAPFWNYYIQVDGINPAVDRIKASGGTVINGPMEVPGGSWIVQGIDPQGAMFALVSSK
jgi:predicted enzyme related to lactoylglutathione lyase